VTDQRKGETPLEQIIEVATFMGQDYFCSTETFIPKKQTEVLVEVALDFLKRTQGSKSNLTIIDMATRVWKRSNLTCNEFR
jgi:methylase of polypeptide subunit release factors